MKKHLKQKITKGSIYSVGLLFIFLCINSCEMLDKMHADKMFAPEKLVGVSIILSDPGAIVYGSKRELTIKGRIKEKEKTFVYMAQSGEKEKFRFVDFDVTVQGGVYEDGKIKVFKKLSQIPTGKLIVKASYKLKAGMDTTITIDLVSNKKSVVAWSGNYGGGGYSGSSGNGGSSGSTTCTDGGYGGHGSNGGDAGDGPDVDVYVKMIHSNEMNKDLVAVRAINTSKSDTTWDYIDAATSSITVYANGGQGGSGGSGGRGGNGGSSTNAGTTLKCRGGDGGDGGDGGNGGNGGRITVYTDSNVDLTKVKVAAENNGGSGGYAGSGGTGGSGNGGARSGRNGRSGSSGKPGPTIKYVKKSLADDMFK